MFTLLVIGCAQKEPPPKPDEAPSESAATVEATALAKGSVETFFDDPGTRVAYMRLCSVETDGSLAATVKASSSTYDLDEDVELVLDLRNTSETAVSIGASNFPVNRCIFTTTHAETRRRRVFTYLEGVGSIDNGTVIEPGATFEQFVSLPAASVARDPVRRRMLTGRYSLVVEYALGFPDDGEIVDGREVTVPLGLVRAHAIELVIRE